MPLHANQHVVFTKLKEGEGVLLHLQSKLYYSLNSTGSFLWQLVENHEALTPEALTERLQTQYQIPKETAAADVEEILKDLMGEGLIEQSK